MDNNIDQLEEVKSPQIETATNENIEKELDTVKNLDEFENTDINDIENKNKISNNDENQSLEELENLQQKILKKNENEIYLDNSFRYKISDGFLENSSLFVELPEIKFCEQIKVEFICDFCHLILWRPVNVSCGHVICEGCQLPSDENVACPVDLLSYDIAGMLIDKNLQKEISELKINCLESDCDWIGNLEDLEEHFKLCTFKKIECTQCGDIVKLIDIDDHSNNLCEYRMLTCQHCNTPMVYKEIENHENNCFHKLVPCPNNCKSNAEPNEIALLKQGFLEDHVNNTCPDRSAQCQFAEFDCKKVTKFRKLNIHLAKNALIHLESLCTSSKNSRDLLESQILTMINLREKIKENEKRFKELQIRSGPQLLWKVVEVQEKYQAAIKSKSSELFSSFFFSTSPYGYKIIMRVMLNGSSAISTGRYISVFISLCDSQYNNLLNWPFVQKVTVHLINQVSGNHISYSIIPNPIKENYDYLKKPEAERNPFFGIDKFAPCTAVDGDTEFVVDNTMFMKINIEPCDVV